MSDLVKERFDAIVHHFEIARIKHDPCRVAVFEQHLLMHGEPHAYPASDVVDRKRKR